MAASPPTVDLSKVPGFDEAPSIDPASASALDELLKQTQENDGEPVELDRPDPTKTPIDPDPTSEEKPAVEEEKPVVEEEKPPVEEKPVAEEKPPVEEKVEDGEPKDDFSEVQLPPTAKGKSREAFDKVKEVARVRIAAVEKERDEFRKKAEELEGKVSQGLPPETEAELKELREFRAKMDVDVSPEFKQYDTQVAANEQSIYDRLAAAGFKPDSIQKIKEIGVAQVDWDAIADKLPVSLRRFIESKLVENEGIVDKKAKAIATAKANATEYMRNREAEVTGSKEKVSGEVDKIIKEYVPKLGWFEPRQAKAGATDAEKKAVEEHNAAVAEYQKFLDQAVHDDTPQLRALLAVGYVQLQKSRSDIAAYKAAKDTEVAELKIKLSDAEKLLEKIKKSSSTRLRGSGAPPASDNPKVSLDTAPGDALDALARQHAAA